MIIDKAIELDSLWLKLKVVLGEVVVNHLDDLGFTPSAVSVWWHEESVVN